MTMKPILSALALAITLPMLATATASAEPSKKAEPSLVETAFGTLEDGGKVTLFTLTNPSGAEARIINYGAIVVSLRSRIARESPATSFSATTILPGMSKTRTFSAPRLAALETASVRANSRSMERAINWISMTGPITYTEAHMASTRSCGRRSR